MSSGKDSNQKPLVMTMPGGLKLTKDGRWVNDGRVVSNKQIADYFYKHFRYDQTLGSYIVEVEGKCVKVELEDAPYIVNGFITRTNPWEIKLTDNTYETFYPETLVVSEEDIFYCVVKKKGQRDEYARILKNALQTLLPLISKEQDNYVLTINDKLYKISSTILRSAPQL